MSDLAGTGVGMRGTHVPRILAELPDIPWLEALADNHLRGTGREQLRSVSCHYPLALHCVGMSIGGTDPIDYDYLSRVRSLACEVEAALISDHLCWTAVEGEHLHDLMPLPYTRSVLDHVCARVDAIQEYLGCPLTVENPSSYFRYRQSDMHEPEFLNELARRSGCRLLLDVNNVYVACVNSGTEPQAYLSSLDLTQVVYIHLAGFEDKGDYLLDAHNHRTAEPVWDLFERILSGRADIPALCEWDRNIPDLDVLMGEAGRADELRHRYQ